MTREANRNRHAAISDEETMTDEFAFGYNEEQITGDLDELARLIAKIPSVSGPVDHTIMLTFRHMAIVRSVYTDTPVEEVGEVYLEFAKAGLDVEEIPTAAALTLGRVEAEREAGTTLADTRPERECSCGSRLVEIDRRGVADRVVCANADCGLTLGDIDWTSHAERRYEKTEASE